MTALQSVPKRAAEGDFTSGYCTDQACFEFGGSWSVVPMKGVTTLPAPPSDPVLQSNNTRGPAYGFNSAAYCDAQFCYARDSGEDWFMSSVTLKAGSSGVVFAQDKSASPGFGETGYCDPTRGYCYVFSWAAFDWTVYSFSGRAPAANAPSFLLPPYPVPITTGDKTKGVCNSGWCWGWDGSNWYPSSFNIPYGMLPLEKRFTFRDAVVQQAVKPSSDPFVANFVSSGWFDNSYFFIWDDTSTKWQVSANETTALPLPESPPLPLDQSALPQTGATTFCQDTFCYSKQGANWVRSTVLVPGTKTPITRTNLLGTFAGYCSQTLCTIFDGASWNSITIKQGVGTVTKLSLPLPSTAPTLPEYAQSQTFFCSGLYCYVMKNSAWVVASVQIPAGQSTMLPIRSTAASTPYGPVGYCDNTAGFCYQWNVTSHQWRITSLSGIAPTNPTGYTLPPLQFLPNSTITATSGDRVCYSMLCWQYTGSTWFDYAFIVPSGKMALESRFTNNAYIVVDNVDGLPRTTESSAVSTFSSTAAPASSTIVPPVQSSSVVLTSSSVASVASSTQIPVVSSSAVTSSALSSAAVSSTVVPTSSVQSSIVPTSSALPSDVPSSSADVLPSSSDIVPTSTVQSASSADGSQISSTPVPSSSDVAASSTVSEVSATSAVEESSVVPTSTVSSDVPTASSEASTKVVTTSSVPDQIVSSSVPESSTESSTAIESSVVAESSNVSQEASASSVEDQVSSTQSGQEMSSSVVESLSTTEVDTSSAVVSSAESSVIPITSSVVEETSTVISVVPSSTVEEASSTVSSIAITASSEANSMVVEAVSSSAVPSSIVSEVSSIVSQVSSAVSSAASQVSSVVISSAASSFGASSVVSSTTTTTTTTTPTTTPTTTTTITTTTTTSTTTTTTTTSTTDTTTTPVPTPALETRLAECCIGQKNSEGCTFASNSCVCADNSGTVNSYLCVKQGTVLEPPPAASYPQPATPPDGAPSAGAVDPTAVYCSYYHCYFYSEVTSQAVAGNPWSSKPRASYIEGTSPAPQLPDPRLTAPDPPTPYMKGIEFCDWYYCYKLNNWSWSVRFIGAD
jgi:hypothetical protein